jgi:hypothetical protein
MTDLRDLCTRPWPIEPDTFLTQVGSGAFRRVELPGGSLTFQTSTARQVSKFAESSEHDVHVLIEAEEALSLDDFEERWVMPLEALILFTARAPSRRKAPRC